jgi:N utilization substance protein B
MVEVTKYAQQRMTAAQNRLAPSAQKEAPNRKFVDNRFIAQLEVNKQLNDFKETQKKSWENETECLKHLCEKIMDSDIYKEYMAAETSSYAEDREFWRKIYKKIIFNNPELDEVLEEQSLYWNDDKEIVDTFVVKTIKRVDEKNGAKQELLPEFKDDDDKEYARRLFRRTVLNADYYRHLIAENTKNWDLNRIAFMDVIIMQIALAEILSFPNIPVSVSLNEYVEIAKLYSTRRSGGFINGTLDGIVSQLKAENKLTKN